MSMRTVELGVGGMTCATCANQVEKALHELPGVQATVNYATGEAFIQAPDAITDNQLLASVERTGYTAALTGKAVELFGYQQFLTRFIVSLLITPPIMFISMIPNLQFDSWQMVTGVLALPVVVWAAWPMHRAAFINLKHRNLTMDSLVSIGILISFGWSIYVSIKHRNHDVAMQANWHSLFTNDPTGTFFEVSCSITTLVLLGKVLELRAKEKSTEALRHLASLNPISATIVQGPFHIVKQLAEVQVGELVFVASGAQVPIDAVVESGSGHVDTSLVTGESQPMLVSSGSKVIGGTVLVDGSITARVSATGQDTVLAAISRLVHRAQSGKAEVTKLVDRVSAIFIPTVFGLAILTSIVWQVINQDLAKSVAVGISVLVIACPCALGLATPTAILVGTGRAAKLGILLRGPGAIEASEKIDTIFLDKTGTLTSGTLEVTKWHSQIEPVEFWQIVGALEQNTVHPTASALINYAKKFATSFPETVNNRTIAGRGVQAEVSGQPCAIGAEDWLGLPSGELADIAKNYSNSGLNTIAVYQDAIAIGIIGVSEQLDSAAKEAISEFIRLGITPVVISGDRNDRVAVVAQALEISDFHGGVQPEEKFNFISQAVNNNHHVAMVGDGINDAAALAAAHLSIAMGDGTDVAASSADIVLLQSNMNSAVTAIKISRATMRTIKTNLGWAFGYNIAAIPLAMCGLLNPMLASAAMAFSSVFVVTNGLRLRKFHSGN